jgi:hypothetical protein
MAKNPEGQGASCVAHLLNIVQAGEELNQRQHLQILFINSITMERITAIDHIAIPPQREEYLALHERLDSLVKIFNRAQATVEQRGDQVIFTLNGMEGSIAADQTNQPVGACTDTLERILNHLVQQQQPPRP